MQTLNYQLHKECSQLLGEQISNLQPVSGGSICQSYKAISASGTWFIKTLAQPPQGMFAAEAFSLEAIAATQTICTPQVIGHCENILILEYLPPEPSSAKYWRRFGTELAHLHKLKQSQFGFAINNYCGTTSQENSYCEDGHQFFVQNRLLPQGQLAVQNGLLNSIEINLLESICSKLDALTPTQPAALIHGDLWSGNHLCSGAKPFLIDPAAHCGWAEAEIAMTRLFGGFPEDFYGAYLEVNPLQSGWQERGPLYNLYHLLNHLNLFGSGYHGQVAQILNYFS